MWLFRLGFGRYRWFLMLQFGVIQQHQPTRFTNDRARVIENMGFGGGEALPRLRRYRDRFTA